MMSYFKDFRSTVFFILFGISFFPIIFKSTISTSDTNHHLELYKPELFYLNTVDKVVAYTDSIYYLSTKKNMDTVLFVSILSKTIKERFRYGQVDYTFSENWIAYLAGKLFWAHLSAIVNPDDLLKRKEGLCSQQTIVFMEALNRKHVNVRTVGLGYKEGPGHFLSEVSYNGSWHLHDVTMEPKWEKVVNHHESIEYYKQHMDSLYLAYNGRLDKTRFYKIMGKVEYGEVNEFPAKNMLLFHQITLIIIFLLPLLFFILFIISFHKYYKIKYSKK